MWWAAAQLKTQHQRGAEFCDVAVDRGNLVADGRLPDRATMTETATAIGLRGGQRRGLNKIAWGRPVRATSAANLAGHRLTRLPVV